MTNKETVNRNISLTFDFVKQLIENPENIQKLADFSELNFIDKDFSYSQNLKQGNRSKRNSFVKVKNSFEV